ncbi:MAG: phage holin family protein, partial [Balneolaceae bacterium]|nr:phage holin family protein [Balneolaceae bacterium]
MSFEKIYELGSKFILIVGTFFAPTFILMGIVGLAILLDTIAGRWAAKHFAMKNGKIVREEVTSRKTRQGTLSKVVVYNLVVLTFFLIDHGMINEVVESYIPWQFLLTKMTVLFICWIEFDSIDEKYYR